MYIKIYVLLVFCLFLYMYVLNNYLVYYINYIMRIYIYKKCMTAGWYSLRALFNPSSCLFPPHVEIQERGRCLWNRSLATGLQQVGGLLPRFFCCRTVNPRDGQRRMHGSILFICDLLMFVWLVYIRLPSHSHSVLFFYVIKHGVCLTCFVCHWFSQFCGRIHLRRPVRPLLGKAHQAHRQSFCLQCKTQVEGDAVARDGKKHIHQEPWFLTGED